RMDHKVMEGLVSHSHSQSVEGSQQLLQAEKWANTKAAIEQQKGKELKIKEAGTLRSHGSCSTGVEETQDKTILHTYFQQNRDKVPDNLLAFVCNIWPEVQENNRIDWPEK
ncbi:V-type proton ATPase subunit G 1, partial [Galemys pyrenaicus]